MMGKAWAKLTVKGGTVALASDLAIGPISLISIYTADSRKSHRQAIARARAWSRRLGGIPVEIED